ncbi:hypothetical protein [Brevundimonas sp. TWP3-1-2b1]|uniref:hypothetical protein n=1 Tax=Brevundimonas sp. TWP3-1-2b1 TaxID=2804650 RepID=UPI003CF78AED
MTAGKPRLDPASSKRSFSPSSNDWDAFAAAAFPLGKDDRRRRMTEGDRDILMRAGERYLSMLNFEAAPPISDGLDELAKMRKAVTLIGRQLTGRGEVAVAVQSVIESQLADPEFERLMARGFSAEAATKKALNSAPEMFAIIEAIATLKRAIEDAQQELQDRSKAERAWRAGGNDSGPLLSDKTLFTDLADFFPDQWPVRYRNDHSFGRSTAFITFVLQFLKLLGIDPPPINEDDPIAVSKRDRAFSVRVERAVRARRKELLEQTKEHTTSA